MITVYAVGSNDLLTSEIKEALDLMLQDAIEVTHLCFDDILDHLDGDLYVCNQSMLAPLSQFVKPEKISILNLTPTSLFYVHVSSIPAHSKVIVFNNKAAYAETLISKCHEMGIENLDFQPVAYSEMDTDAVCDMLTQAHYVIGVNKLVGPEVLMGEPYGSVLQKDVRIIAAKRVASTASSIAIVHRINQLVHQKSVEKIEHVFHLINKTHQAEGLYLHTKSLDTTLNYLEKRLSNSDEASIQKRQAALRSVLNQIATRS
jgi:hypothetical protein